MCIELKNCIFLKILRLVPVIYLPDFFKNLHCYI
nr:MAG TPA: hypothetical protein [Inoviridae sp.]